MLDVASVWCSVRVMVAGGLYSSTCCSTCSRQKAARYWPANVLRVVLLCGPQWEPGIANLL
jgi:hypothetical protein